MKQLNGMGKGTRYYVPRTQVGVAVATAYGKLQPMAWFKKVRKPIEPRRRTKAASPKGCGSSARRAREIIYNKDLAATLNVCPKCAHHFRIGAAERLRMLFDGDWEEYDPACSRPIRCSSSTPSRTGSGWKRRSRRPGMKDAVICATGAHRRHRDVGRGDGIHVHRRQHGRGRRREDHARDRARASSGGCRSSSSSSLGRRAHDGRARCR